MPPTRKIHGLDGIPGLNGFECFRVVLSGVESFLVVLSGARWFRLAFEGSIVSLLLCLGRFRGPKRVALWAPEGPFFCV